MTEIARRYAPFLILPLVLMAIVVVSTLRAGADPSSDPEAGLTDDELQEQHSQGEATAIAQRSQIARDFLASGEPIASLDRVGSLVDTLEPPLSPKEALDQANAVIRGVVKDQVFEVDPASPGAGRVVSTIEVTDPIKGTDIPATVTLEQPGSISLNASGEFVLVTYDFNPPARLGTDVIVFMRSAPSGRYETLPFTDVSISSDGLVEPGEASKEFEALRGRPAAELLAELR